jgi:hypothetical protein
LYGGPCQDDANAQFDVDLRQCQDDFAGPNATYNAIVGAATTALQNADTLYGVGQQSCANALTIEIGFFEAILAVALAKVAWDLNVCMGGCIITGPEFLLCSEICMSFAAGTAAAETAVCELAVAGACAYYAMACMPPVQAAYDIAAATYNATVTDAQGPYNSAVETYEDCNRAARGNLDATLDACPPDDGGGDGGDGGDGGGDGGDGGDGGGC